jgi:anti-anti-sigma factor
MTLPLQNLHGYRFGIFEVDLELAELRKNGRKIRLQEKPFQILVTLLERSGKLVNREDLRQRLWAADTFVDFDNGLNTAMSKLRVALGDAAEKPRYIETFARRGYRFIASVEEFGTQPTAQLRELEVRTTRIEPDVALVEIVGKVVHGPECRQIEWLIADLLREGQRKVVLDISRVLHLDSAGVGIIVMCYSRLKDTGGELRVAGAEGPVETVLKTTGVGRIVPLYSTAADALQP